MAFEFVDNSAAVIDGATRKRIRSHAALGHNLGRKLSRPSRKKWDISKDRIPPIQRPIDDSFSIPSFTDQVKPKSKYLVQRAIFFMGGLRYAPELTKSIDAHASKETPSPWIQFMYLDKAYFHCAIAVSVIALNNLVMEQEDPREAMRHLSHTFRMVNERLSGNDAVSDITMAVVVLMTHYDRLQGNYRQGLIHLNGLQRMVELRGGISQLTKTCLPPKLFRADLDFALHLGSATRYSIEDIIPSSSAILEILGKFRLQNNEKVLKVFDSPLSRKLNPELRNLFIEITSLAWLLNDTTTGHQPKVDGYMFHDTLLLFGYRLVKFSPLGGPRPHNSLENAIHIGLTAFILTFLVGIDSKVISIPLLYGLARSVAQETFNDDKENEVLLWLLCVCRASSLFQESDDTWLSLKVMHTMYILGLHTWKDISKILARFPWVGVVHDKAGQFIYGVY